MSDYALCSAPGVLPACVTCWRNPDVHPFATDPHWQAWLAPALTDGQCAHFVEQDKSK